MNSFSNTEILTLWQMPGETMWRIALQQALQNLPQSASLCVELLRTAPKERLDGCVKAFLSKLPFLKEGYAPVEKPTKLTVCDTFASLAESYKAILQDLKARDDQETAKLFYLYFNGLRPDLTHLFPKTDFKRLRRDNENIEKDGHQLMVFVTGLCNLNCSYCFSNDIERRQIAADDLRIIIKWAAENGCSSVTPCGGEPLMYKHIGLFLDLVQDYGMYTYFASNCTYPLSRFTERQAACIKSLTFHITEALWKNKEYMRVFCENINWARQRGINIIARFNIVKPNTDFTKCFELIEKQDLKCVNIALTIPDRSQDNTFVGASHFSDFADDLQRVIGFCKERKISLSFAKPVPPCAFPEDEALQMLAYDNFLPFCNVHEDGGTRNVCISPAKYITPCLGISAPKVLFSEKMTWDTLYKQMGAEVHCALRQPLFEKCNHCFLYHRHLCQGACLSYKKCGING